MSITEFSIVILPFDNEFPSRILFARKSIFHRNKITPRKRYLRRGSKRQTGEAGEGVRGAKIVAGAAIEVEKPDGANRPE